MAQRLYRHRRRGHSRLTRLRPGHVLSANAATEETWGSDDLNQPGRDPLRARQTRPPTPRTTPSCYYLTSTADEPSRPTYVSLLPTKGAQHRAPTRNLRHSDRYATNARLAIILKLPPSRDVSTPSRTQTRHNLLDVLGISLPPPHHHAAHADRGLLDEDELENRGGNIAGCRKPQRHARPSVGCGLHRTV